MMYSRFFVPSIPIVGWLSYSLLEPVLRTCQTSVLIETKNDYRIYLRHPMLKAEIAIQADGYMDALEKGGIQLNEYLNGANTRKMPIESVYPVICRKLASEESKLEDPLILVSEKLKSSKSDLYLISFLLSPSYNKALLGKPNNPYIKIRDQEQHLVASRAFWGYLTRKNVEKHRKVLEESLKRDGYELKEVGIASYSHFFTFYFLRKNEVFMELDETPRDMHLGMAMNTTESQKPLLLVEFISLLPLRVWRWIGVFIIGKVDAI